MEEDITSGSLLARGWHQDTDLSRVEQKGRRTSRKIAYRKGYWIVWLYEDEMDGIIKTQIKASSAVDLGHSSTVKTIRELEDLAI